MTSFLTLLVKALKTRAAQVVLVLFLYFCIASLLPTPVHQGFYTISLFIKDLLIWILPVTVGLFIADVICSFERKASLFILAIILFEGFSNLCSVWYAFGSGHLAINFLGDVQLPSINDSFDALWRLPFTKPSWWSADKGTFLGMFIGYIATFSKKEQLHKFIRLGKNGAQWVLTKVFSRFIPLFVLGFVARMYQTKLIEQLFSHYAALLLWLLVFLALYILILFSVGSGFLPKVVLRSIKNLFPAGSIAFTSGCSLSTMPWTIEGTAKNLRNPEFAKAIIPATTNIQQIGDCIVNTFLCFLIYKHCYGHSPDLATWGLFSVMFVLARFATAAVLGGAIFIMLPIYETYLSFNPEMIAIILAFNVVLDPIVTTCNVMANGALCRVFERVWLYLFGEKEIVTD